MPVPLGLRDLLSDMLKATQVFSVCCSYFGGASRLPKCNCVAYISVLAYWGGYPSSHHHKPLSSVPITSDGEVQLTPMGRDKVPPMA